MPGLPAMLFEELSPLQPRFNNSPTTAPFVPTPEKFRAVSDEHYNVACAILILTPIVHAFSTLLFVGRAYTRMVPTFRFGLDDYLICVAWVCMTCEWAFQYDAVSWAAGFRRLEFKTLEHSERTFRDGVLALPFWAWSTGLIKISIAWMLLRFQRTAGWRSFVYAMIVLNIFFICFLGIANIFNCVPYASQWDFSGKYSVEKGNKKCWPKSAQNSTIYATVTVNVISDVVLSLVPLTFLRKVQRPLREKIVIGSLLGLGIFASVFAILRMITQVAPTYLVEPGANGVFSGLMTCLETEASFIAACLPALRSSANRWIQKVGLWKGSSMGTSRYQQYQRYGPDKDTDYGPKSTRGTELSRMGTTGGGITKKTEIHTTTHVSGSNESDHFIMDPKTGRIVPESDLKHDKEDQDSIKNLNAEWEGEPGKRVKEEWQTQRDIEHAR